MIRRQPRPRYIDHRPQVRRCVLCARQLVEELKALAAMNNDEDQLAVLELAERADDLADDIEGKQ